MGGESTAISPDQFATSVRPTCAQRSPCCRFAAAPTRASRSGRRSRERARGCTGARPRRGRP
eukprot:2815959-Prymnesium_polylepis.1